MTRVVMIEITGADEHLVTVLANLVADDAKLTLVAMDNFHEHFGDLDPSRSADDPPAVFPKVNITNTVMARTT